jgi:hypothetical protein
MSREIDRLRMLSLAAQEQRARLRTRIGATRSRLAPSRLKDDARIRAEAAVTDAARGVSDGVKRHPFAAGLAVAGALAWAFRDPLLAHGPRWLKDAYDRLAGHRPFIDDIPEDHGEGETAIADEFADNDNDGAGTTGFSQEDPLRHD